MAPSLTRLVVGAFSLAALIGCVDQDEGDGSDAVVDGKADGISSFKVKLTSSSGTYRATDTPKLTTGSTGSFACATDARTPNGWRLVCTRSKEQLTLVYGPDDRVGAAIYKRSTSSPDKRNYFHCTATAADPDKWPTELSCAAKSPRTNIGGQLVSPFSSSLDDIGIFNSHVVSESGTTKVFRGMKPFRDADFDDLKSLGVDAVLIFKKPTAATEVDEETDALAPIGVSAANVINVPFLWKDFPDFESPCRMTVRSLKALDDWSTAGKTSFFHCTVGEDRTGYLAGLYRLLTETAPVRTIFDEEMCERGYSAGNPQKPMFGVANEVDADLTPIFLKMAFKISTGELAPGQLDESVCATDPATDPAFTGAQWTASGYRCAVSTRYRL